MKLLGQCAVITGAGAGIGKAIALRMAREGAAVVLGDIQLENAEATARAIREESGRALSCHCDVMESQEVAGLMWAAREAFGPIDILVNNAGGAIVAGPSMPFAQSTEEAMARMLGVNLVGTLLCSRAVVPEMCERRRGKVINMASIAGVVGAKSVLYATAKGGIIAFTKSLAMEVGAFGVCVNAISPGAIATRPGPASKSTYLNRTGTAEEVANLVLFLASPEADFITGENILIDGGRTCGAKGD